MGFLFPPGCTRFFRCNSDPSKNRLTDQNRRAVTTFDVRRCECESQGGKEEVQRSYLEDHPILSKWLVKGVNQAIYN